MILLLAACGHMPETRSPRLLQAIEFNQQGEKAFRYGEYQSAIDNFQESLRLNESVENLDGIAINRINLAKSYQELENFAEAQRHVDSVLQENVLRFSDVYLAAAATQKSILSLSRNEVDEATRWIDKAVDMCGKCSLQGVMFNVRGSIALRRNDAAMAAHWGELALKENKERSPMEYANSLRLLARAKLSGNAAAGALPLLEQALLLDKQLGTSEKIAQDMNVMADVYLSLGEQDKAHEYSERAKRVAGKIRDDE